MPTEALYIGLMSGTSMDGIDAVLVDLAGAAPSLRASHSHPYPDKLRTELAALTTPGENEIDRMGQLDIRVGRCFAEAVNALLEVSNCPTESITAIGSHGQTIRHRPGFTVPFTLQIGDPNTISQGTGITTVADFRRRDMAAGGEGAPLVPAFHEVVLRSHQRNRVILNLGGIANITWLPADSASTIVGFDTGPANVLLDQWIEHQLGKCYDQDGALAASGRVDQKLLNQLLQEPYFQRDLPKSTGTDHFNLKWLEAHPQAHELSVETVQSTLVELTAVSVTQAVTRHCPQANEMLVCGGGVHNRFLLSRLRAHAGRMKVTSTADVGVDPDWIEATAFAWLAQRTLKQLPGNLPSVTGASQPVILGGIYPA